MNSILELPSPSPEIEPNPEAPPQFDHRGNGKIARLPKLIRDQVNNWLLDGLSYPDIIQRLGDHGKDLKPDHISQWKKRGYQDWFRQREWLEHLTSKSEFSTDILAAPDSSALHEAGLRLAASQMFDQLMRFSASANTADSKGQPEQFSRLVNALSRLTREALAFQKYRAATAKENTLELKRLDPNRKSSEKERDVVLHLWRDFFGHDLTQPDPTDAESTPIPSEAVEASQRVEIQKSKVKNEEAEPASQIQNQKSKIKNTGVSPAEKQLETKADKHLEELPMPVAAIEIQKSKIKNPAAIPPIKTQKPKIETASPGDDAGGGSADERSTPSSEDQNAEIETEEIAVQASDLVESKFKIQNSKIETCYDCGAPLPLLLPNGQRPSPACVACGARLYPPGTGFDQCHFCQAYQPILANGERPSPQCRRCNNTLAPPGQRFVTNCPACGFDLPALTAQGTRISDRCPDCRALLPLLEPLPPP